MSEKRKITILGMGPSAHRKADCIEQFTEGTEVFSMNNAYLTYPSLFTNRGFDRMYELHSWDYLQEWVAGEMQGQKVDHFKTLQVLNCDVFTVEPLPVIRKQVEFPCTDILRAFGENVEIKGSPSWILAHILLEHAQGNEVEYIQSYGIDTADPSHQCQRPSWAQWTLLAEKMGIRLGGTMLDFRKDPDQDAGLSGLLDYAKTQLKNENALIEVQQQQEEDQNNELRCG